MIGEDPISIGIPGLHARICLGIAAAGGTARVCRGAVHRAAAVRTPQLVGLFEKVAVA